MKRYKKFIKTGEPVKDFLRDLFEAGGMSACKLADKADIDRSLPYSWLSGRSKPSTMNLIKICNLVSRKTQQTTHESSGEFKTMRWWLDRGLEVCKRKVDKEVLEKVIAELDLETTEVLSDTSAASQPKNQLLAEIISKLGADVQEAFSVLTKNPQPGKCITITQIVISLE